MIIFSFTQKKKKKIEGYCPEPSSTPDDFMGGFCAFNFTSGPAAGKFCWDRQPEYSAYRETSFGHGILEVLPFLQFTLLFTVGEPNYE